ncbi:EpsG family protein [Culturomica massiliensis]|uniref:EpsG family protein n=1 Tax=Culturomica massiliensis TaxID=1841857 RepID=UPI0026707B05|nr:EpsG family protein [Culturomica massiliensis]
MAEEELLFIRYFYWILLVALVLQVVISFCQYLSPRFPVNIWNKLLSVLLIAGVSMYIGGRDICIGADTDVYWEYYEELRTTSRFWTYGEPVFYFFMFVFARLFTFQAFLTFCAFVYIGGAYLGMKRFFSGYALYSLLLFFISPDFFLYGINVIRNGFAASVFLMSFYWWGKSSWKMYGMMLLAVLCHFSMLLPLLVFVASRNWKSTLFLLIVWTVSLILYFANFTIGAQLGYILPDFGRVNQYFNDQAEEPLTALINFFVYGASPVFAGIYYVYFKKYNDRVYLHLLNVYILLNAFYVQFMDIKFAVRFAYLSEFLMPIVLIYPLLKERIWPLRFWVLSLLLLSVFFIKAVKILF